MPSPLQPVWDEYLYSGIKTVSENLVRQAHPGWDNATVLTEATREFEAAARAYYLTTIATLKAARPRMRVGFYDTPFRGFVLGRLRVFSFNRVPSSHPCDFFCSSLAVYFIRTSQQRADDSAHHFHTLAPCCSLRATRTFAAFTPTSVNHVARD